LKFSSPAKLRRKSILLKAEGADVMQYPDNGGFGRVRNVEVMALVDAARKAKK
jgi:hypothetical protein